MAIPKLREARDAPEPVERDAVAAAAALLAERIAAWTPEDIERYLVATYRWHTAIRAALVDARRAANERARLGRLRGAATDTAAEVDRACERACQRVLARHGLNSLKTADEETARTVRGELFAAVAATAAATCLVRGEAIEHIERTPSDEDALQIVADLTVLGEPDPLADRHEDAATGVTVVRARGHEYLLETLHERANAPQRLLVEVMVRLDFAAAAIGRVLSVARGTKVDRAQLARLVAAARQT